MKFILFYIYIIEVCEILLKLLFVLHGFVVHLLNLEYKRLKIELLFC